MDGTGNKHGAGESAQQLEVLATLVEHAGLASSSHMAAHNYPQVQLQGPFWPLWTPDCTQYTCMQAEHSHT